MKPGAVTPYRRWSIGETAMAPIPIVSPFPTALIRLPVAGSRITSCGFGPDWVPHKTCAVASRGARIVAIIRAKRRSFLIMSDLDGKGDGLLWEHSFINR